MYKCDGPLVYTHRAPRDRARLGGVLGPDAAPTFRSAGRSRLDVPMISYIGYCTPEGRAAR